MRSIILVGLLGSVMFAAACATTTTSSRMWTVPRQGHVEWVRETVRETKGNPAGGAAAGAVVGGLLGGMLTGRGVGAVLGAAGGAMVGAGSSQEHKKDRFYDVLVRFDDGSASVFRYRGIPPFQPGQPVILTPRGLVAHSFVTSPPLAAAPTPSKTEAGESDSDAQPAAPHPEETPPPPPSTPAPAPQTQSEQATTSMGQWVFTRQYGWVWMPYGAAYTFTPDYENGEPYMYVYYPAHGWVWVSAPWLWGWGPRPYLSVRGAARFSWYGHDWGHKWRGHRSTHYRIGPRRRHHGAGTRR